MESLQLLKAVADQYVHLQSLKAEFLEISESRSDGSSQRNERRTIVHYAAPNRVRIEQAGGAGAITVSDGDHVHHYFREIKRYSKQALPEPDFLPGRFRPEYPISGDAGTFLYHRIHERVVEATILREETLNVGGIETPCQVVTVTYQPPPQGGLFLSTSPIQFWIDSRTLAVVRWQGRLTPAARPHRVAHTSEHTNLVTCWDAGRTIPAEIFHFEVPPDALDISNPSGRGCISVGGGVGFTDLADGEKSISHQSQHAWNGDVFVEQEEWTFRGHRITFERRWTLSEDGREVRISERIVGPKGEQKRTIAIPVAS